MIPIIIENFNEFKKIADKVADDLYDLVHEILIDGSYILKKKNPAISLDPEAITILNKLDNKSTISKLVFIKPSRLHIVARLIKRELTIYPKAVQDIGSIFIDLAYTRILDRQNLINSIGLKTCPYCNRSYVYTIKAGKINPELDHFYPKSVYPILAVSVFNLIPSCAICNSTGAKGAKDPLNKEYLLRSPYLIKHEDFHFNYKLLSPEIVTGKYSGESIEIYFDTCNTPANDKVFHLSSLYKKHDDHIVDMLYKKKYIYTKRYLSTLKRITKGKVRESELDRFIVGAYVDRKDYHRRPLSKLYTEIAQEIGLIKKR